MRGDERQASAWPSKVWRGGGGEGTGSGEVKVGGGRPGHSGASACMYTGFDIKSDHAVGTDSRVLCPRWLRGQGRDGI